jgi:hypothetical protein
VPADEHGDAAAHDVEARPLLLDLPGQPRARPAPPPMLLPLAAAPRLLPHAASAVHGVGGRRHGRCGGVAPAEHRGGGGTALGVQVRRRGQPPPPAAGQRPVAAAAAPRQLRLVAHRLPPPLLACFHLQTEIEFSVAGDERDETIDRPTIEQIAGTHLAVARDTARY